MAFFIPGYAGTIWSALRAGLQYVSVNLDTADPEASKALILAMSASLRNGLNAIEANQFYTASNQNYVLLAPVLALDLTLDPVTQSFLANRVAALQQATISAAFLSVAPMLLNATLPRGLPLIADPLFVEWLINYNFETPPFTLTADNFAVEAQAAADCWATIANAMQTQGVVFSGSSLNVVLQMGLAAEVVASEVANLPILPSATNLMQAWNWYVSMPTITRLASLVYNDPTSLLSQQVSIIRYVILTLLDQFNLLLVSLRQPPNSQVQLATVQQGDSLMDIAARALGNFELWYQIAQINGLQPPFIGPAPAPGIAAPGQQLFLPTPTTTTPQGSVPNYLINYLGVDIFLGPLNADMLPWSGDFETITGYQNLSLSLGRRLQTTLGDLIYHTDFGSRVPPEVGMIDSGAEAGRIQAFTESALLSDPRVNKIVSCTVQVLPNYLIAVNATVLPNGLNAEQVTINEVLGPS